MAVVYWIHLPEHSDLTTQGYVGVSKTNARNRYYGHTGSARRGSHLPVHAAIRKYGDKLLLDTIVEASPEYCYEVEGKLRASPRIGWNLAVGGDVSPTLGTEVSEGTRAKIGASSRGRKCPPRTVEHRLALSVRMSGKNNPMYGVKVSDGARKKISIANKGKIATPETRARMSATNARPMLGKTAYRDPKCNKEVWKSANDLYELYRRFKRCGCYKLATASKRFTADNLETITNKFKSGWIPSEDTEYLDWLKYIPKD